MFRVYHDSDDDNNYDADDSDDDEHKVCMESIKQKSRDVSETDIYIYIYVVLTAMKDLLDKLGMEEKKVEALKKQKRCPCFHFAPYIVALYHYFNDNE